MYGEGRGWGRECGKRVMGDSLTSGEGLRGELRYDEMTILAIKN